MLFISYYQIKVKNEQKKSSCSGLLAPWGDHGRLPSRLCLGPVDHSHGLVSPEATLRNSKDKYVPPRLGWDRNREDPA